MIRLRRIPASGLLRRRRYEVEIVEAGESTPRREITTTPVTLIDKYIGVGDAWSVVHAADDAWDGRSGEWVSLRDEAS
jgi:hypothetical protein